MQTKISELLSQSLKEALGVTKDVVAPPVKPATFSVPPPPTIKLQMSACPICECQVRSDRLNKHLAKAHPTAKAYPVSQSKPIARAKPEPRSVILRFALSPLGASFVTKWLSQRKHAKQKAKIKLNTNESFELARLLRRPCKCSQRLATM